MEEKQEEEWPSKRVVKGGIFNLPKVKYSKETHDFLNCKLQIIPCYSENVIHIEQFYPFTTHNQSIN